jgi:hypothetical protein
MGGYQDQTSHSLKESAAKVRMCVIGLFVVVLAQSAACVANALQTIYAMGVNGNAFKQLAARLMLRFAGE